MFITFEGIEGSGKTTQIERAAAHIRASGRPCVVTREPGGTEIGLKIREILLDRKHTGLDADAELMLYMADRIQHVKTVILPALDRKKIVLCDRFLDATLAYQGYGRGLDISFIRKLHRTTVGGIEPDLTLLLDLPVEKGLGRAWERIKKAENAGGESRFEEESLVFHERVRKGYLALARANVGRIRVIDAAKDMETIHREVIQIVSAALGVEKKVPARF